MEFSRVAVSGASGFIGKKLVEELRTEGLEVWPMVRTKTKKPYEIFYDYQQKIIDTEKLAQCTAVIHLAGKNIMGGWWTPAYKKEIYDSRVKSTRFIAHTLAQMKQGPKTLLNASAIGIYGDRADQKLDEDSLPGPGFLADLCVDWERGTLFAKKAQMRVVNTRFGMVLDPEGGFLKQIEGFFKVGLGIFPGSDEQYFSYVTRNQLISQLVFILKNPKISGPVNCVAYEPATNKEFADALSNALRRRHFCQMPRFFFKLLGDQGKMALASARVYPKVLIDNGFPFKEERINKALEDLYR